MLCLQAILLFMSSMHRFGGLLYFPMPDGMIILRYEHRFISLHYYPMPGKLIILSCKH